LNVGRKGRVKWNETVPQLPVNKLILQNHDRAYHFPGRTDYPVDFPDQFFHIKMSDTD